MKKIVFTFRRSVVFFIKALLYISISNVELVYLGPPPVISCGITKICREAIVDVTITYTIIAKSISETYAFSVNGDTLNLTKLDDGTVKTFMRYTAPETTAPETTVA